MRLGQDDGVQISRPDLGYELSLSGKVDYAVIEYENVEERKGESVSNTITPPHGLFSLVGRPRWI
jgi:hypothetical protein